MRICVNMSVGLFVSTSTLRLIGMPRSSAFWIGGIPWPICISIGPATEKRPAGVGDSRAPGR